MPIQIQIRRGTFLEWEASNPLLAEGELGLETDTAKFKIGNGVDVWNDLEYASGQTGPSGLTPVFTRQGTLTAGVGEQRLYVERVGTITRVRATVGTTPSGSNTLIDVLKNGTTVLSSPIAIVPGQYTAMGVIADGSLDPDDYLTVDIVSVGSSFAGANLVVTAEIL